MAKQSTGQTLRSAERMLDVLEAFSLHQPALTAAEVSEQLELAPSTVRRLLNVLEQHGFVRVDPMTGQFAPHYQVVRLAAVALEGNDLISNARVPLDLLHDRTQEAAQLVVLSDHDIVFVDRRESSSLIKIFSAIGQRYPAWDGRASGKVLLAWLPEDDVSAMLPAPEDWAQAGPNAAPTPQTYLEELAKVRAQGYAVNDEETDRDVWAVAAPVRDHTGRVVAAINVPVLKTRATDPNRVAELIDATTTAAASVSEGLKFFFSH
ncbi:IclR family transcriptional regulator (plasmid) [Rhodococcus opacus]|uniref:IclR family transcriptional regulator n=2 Tax=Rhodococcus opacus TaxID=37919 RepID=UPI0006BB5126|nr:IclR family transcriptional regulator [Rhodococcus opacus]MDV7090480.1 IclR family transcriptional regulator [Rhodococcus opacus]WKN52478.1 IclR family transcriptional regulator [Rhodococcus opacus]